MSLCSDALAYAARGWAVFPLLPNKKTPATPHGFKDATTDPETIRRLFATPCNLAIRTGQGLCVLDVDVRQGKRGDETLHDLEAHHGRLPETYSVKTWSGGQHYYFSYAGTLSSKNGLDVGIDFKADGGYVCAPPSVIDDKPYTLDSNVPLAPLPPWIVAKLALPPPPGTSFGEHIPLGQQDTELHRLACSLARQRFSDDTIHAALTAAMARCEQDPRHPFTEHDVQRWLTGAKKFRPDDTPWSGLGIASKEKAAVCNAAAALAVLEQRPEFTNAVWFDSFRQRLRTTWEETSPRDWQDSDTQRLLIFLQRDVQLHRMSRSSVEDALGEFGSRHTRHAVQDWVKTLRWDGVPRLATWLPTMMSTADDPYHHQAGRNFWVSLLARVFLPGCQVDHMLVLEGPQGQGKTKALRIIGGEWYAAMSCSVMDKDFFQLLQGKLIIELAELDSFQRAELTRIKQAISTPSDTYRASYGRYARTVARQCVFVGTTNELRYLRDLTGARRFWPVRCGDIDTASLTAQRELLFAEAYQLFRSGAGWHEMPEETVEEQEARREVDAWEAPISAYCQEHFEVTITQVLTEACQVPLGQAGRGHSLRVSALLRKLGWEAESPSRQGEHVVRLWRRTETRQPGEDVAV